MPCASVRDRDLGLRRLLRDAGCSWTIFMEVPERVIMWRGAAGAGTRLAGVGCSL